MRRSRDTEHRAQRDPAPGALHAEVLSRVDAVEALAPEWDELADACGAGPFARPGYALTWWRHLGRGRLLVAVVRDADGELVALAGLHARRVGPLRVGRWLGHGLGTVAEALVRPGRTDAAAALWQVLADPLLVLQLTETRERSAGLEALTSAPTRATTSVRRNRCPVVALDPGVDEMAGSGHRRIRRTLRVAEQRVAEAGLEFRVETVTDRAGFDRLLPDIRSVYDAAEAAYPRLHLLQDPWQPFALELLTRGVASGQVVVLVGYLDRRPVCFDIALVGSDTMSAWVGRYDPSAASYSPGHLLQQAGLAWARDHGMRTVDLLLGDDDYKRRWATGGYDTLEVTSGRPATMALVAPMLRLAARRHEAG